MKIQWRLRMAAAQREVWTGTELRRLLAEKAGLELSSASVSALFTKEPSQVKMTTLAALCTALGCTPNDLIEVDTTPVERPVAPPRPVAELPRAASARGRSMPPCDRRQRWARSSGTASRAVPRSGSSTASTAAGAGAG
ncbi:helix-turn-helix domain-containing protein [Streptomyces mirabilis]|uniref:helix-turn-helix domain-containing protein n=1 Tax=Streptomyces mirabilis TaxID=68239 RepID=UPI00362A8A78